MPAISTLEVCQHTLGYNTFNSEVLDLAPEAAPAWLTYALVGISVGPPEVATYEYTVANDAPIGVHTIELAPGGEYLTITVTDCAIEVEVCLLTQGTITPDPPEGYEAWADYLEDTGTQAIFFEGVLYYQFTEVGEYFYTLIADGRTPQQGPYVVYKFIVTNCFLEDDSCKEFPLMIVWLNPTGGMSSYVFNGKKTFSQDIGESSTWKDENKITRYREHKNIYDGVFQPSGYLHPDIMDFIKSLKRSIQAWEVRNFGEETEEWVPIFNYARSFEFKRQKNGLYKYDFEYSYSEEITNQTA